MSTKRIDNGHLVPYTKRMESSEPKGVLSVRINAALLDRIDQLCERTGVGRAEITERCLEIGLADEEEFVRSLESPVVGAAMHLLSYPKVLKALLTMIGEEPHPTQVQIRNNIAEKKRVRSAAHGKPATK